MRVIAPQELVSGLRLQVSGRINLEKVTPEQEQSIDLNAPSPSEKKGVIFSSRRREKENILRNVG